MTINGMKCTSCGKIAQPDRLRFQGIEIDGWRCNCGEDYFDPEQAQRILLLNKVRSKEYEVTIGQIRSNLIIRIPTELAEALDFHKGEKVHLKAESENSLHVEASSL